MNNLIVTEQHSIVLQSAVEEVTGHKLQEAEYTIVEHYPLFKSMDQEKLFFHVEQNGDVILNNHKKNETWKVGNVISN